ncbi:DUF5317 domain-containing protein [Effusibacillus consociatus]|uniref:DUF5317 domain-containing protein n=1 Tax=Effusibacillus consociatus TaxID=1117041 RepID=A0ABV9PZY4_9BACL
MIIDGFVLGILVAKIRGGKFRDLLNVELGSLWLIVLAFLLQYAIIIFNPSFLNFAVPLSYGLLLLFSYLNRNQLGFRWIQTGLFLNLLVMTANGGRMPVDASVVGQFAPEKLSSLSAGESGKHIAMSSDTHLNLLGDIFYLHAPYPHEVLVSLGDILFSVGVFIFIQKVMVKRRSPIQGSVVNGT